MLFTQSMKKNNEILVVRHFSNVYYDIAIEDIPITPYSSVSVGAARISTPLKATVDVLNV